jgi:RNA polymerase sigma factor (sigma-70 family)
MKKINHAYNELLKEGAISLEKAGRENLLSAVAQRATVDKVSVQNFLFWQSKLLGKPQVLSLSDRIPSESCGRLAGKDTDEENPMGSDGQAFIALNDLVSYPKSSRIDYQDDDLKRAIDDALGTLKSKERDVIKLRYGLGDGHSYSLEDVSKIFRITEERARQIEARAINKLKNGDARSTLLPFLDDKT